MTTLTNPLLVRPDFRGRTAADDLEFEYGGLREKETASLPPRWIPCSASLKSVPSIGNIRVNGQAGPR